MVISGVFALLLLITAIPMIVYAGEWREEVEDEDGVTKETLEKIPPALEAAAVCHLHELDILTSDRKIL